MSTYNPYIDYYANQALGKQLQIGGSEFYKGLPWQKGYGLGGLLGSLARRFIPLLKPLAKSAGKKLLRAGTSIVSDIIDGEPVGDVLQARLKKINRKKSDRQDNRPKKRNKKRRRYDSNPIPEKRRRGKQDIFS